MIARKPYIHAPERAVYKSEAIVGGYLRGESNQMIGVTKEIGHSFDIKSSSVATRQSRCKHRFTLAAPSVLSLNIIYYNLSEVHKSLM